MDTREEDEFYDENPELLSKRDLSVAHAFMERKFSRAMRAMDTVDSYSLALRGFLDLEDALVNDRAEQHAMLFRIRFAKIADRLKERLHTE